MKIRNKKMPDGKTRKFLVERYWDRTDKKKKQRQTDIEGWSKEYVVRLIDLTTEHAKLMANAQKEDATKVFRRIAEERAAKMRDRIDKLKKLVREKLVLRRAAFDRRRINEATGKRWRQYSSGKTPYVAFLSACHKLDRAIDKLRDEPSDPKPSA